MAPGCGKVGAVGTSVDTPVLVVGAGPAGLAVAASLRRKGVHALLVDKGSAVDQKLLTGRRQEDLPAFCASLITLLSTAIDERRLDKMVEQSFPASDPLPGPIALP